MVARWRWRCECNSASGNIVHPPTRPLQHAKHLALNRPVRNRMPDGAGGAPEQSGPLCRFILFVWLLGLKSAKTTQRCIAASLRVYHLQSQVKPMREDFVSSQSMIQRRSSKKRIVVQMPSIVPGRIYGANPTKSEVLHNATWRLIGLPQRVGQEFHANCLYENFGHS